MSGNVCTSYLLLYNKLVQVERCKIIHIYYLTAVLGQKSDNSLAGTSAQAS